MIMTMIQLPAVNIAVKIKNHKSQKVLAGCDKKFSMCCLHETVIILKCFI